MYTIQISRRVRKEVKRLPAQDQGRIVATLKALANEPRPAGCEPVKTAEKGTYRIRVGAYRIVYVIEDTEKVILVARVSRRKEDTYRGL